MPVDTLPYLTSLLSPTTQVYKRPLQLVSTVRNCDEQACSFVSKQPVSGNHSHIQLEAGLPLHWAECLASVDNLDYIWKIPVPLPISASTRDGATPLHRESHLSPPLCYNFLDHIYIMTKERCPSYQMLLAWERWVVRWTKTCWGLATNVSFTCELPTVPAIKSKTS